MPHHVPLIATIAIALALAFAAGLLATRLRLPPLIGYLLAGVAIGPKTPGFVADVSLASQLAEIGVILLMFGVGMHFSVRDLMAVRAIALPGAIVQIVVAVAMGASAAQFWGWSLPAGIVFGLALSVASTVVMLRALEQRGMVSSLEGRIAVGWLVVEDLVMVVVLVLLPVLAGTSGASGPDALALAGQALWLLVKIGAFFVVMHFVGVRLFPWLFEQVAGTGSRELVTLFVIGLALGIAYGSALALDVSFALGAFFAGVVINESQLTKRVAAEAVPLENAFAVLFFVSVGMLFDPVIIMQRPFETAVVVAIIVVGKSFASLLIVLAFRYPLKVALTVSASLAQIGEFSFILAALGVSMGVLETEAQSLVLAGALLSITLNPLVFATIGPVHRFVRRRPALAAFIGRLQRLPDSDEEVIGLRDHVIVVGYGRVGRVIAEELAGRGVPFVIIEQSHDALRPLEGSSTPYVFGDATNNEVLTRANPAEARLLIVATPDALQAGRILALARLANPQIDSAIRTHSEEELDFIRKRHAGLALMAEQELALGLARYALDSYESAHRADGRSRA